MIFDPMILSRRNFPVIKIVVELHPSSPRPSKSTATMVLIIFLVACLVACGDPKYQPPAIVVTFSSEFPPPSALGLSATAPIAAIVTNGPPNDGLAQFSCLPAGQCGSFTPNPI